ncbi:outer membrane protein [Candidatus Odyssella thessalonicensis]|uniref:outer membrane protein n=1 Tax=Candidatus Odyssella thessalonicensis TaxID=84647 RepID=UPI000225A904|nr:outer membrane beta-barrel protein [Candidatus Odyssella thessalonicensis]
MKKIIASAVVAIATLSASQAAVFNGASAGLTAGVLNTNNTFRFNHDVPGVTNGSHKSAAAKGLGSFGIHFDYDRSAANAFYWGLGLDLMFYTGKATKSSAITDATIGVNVPVKMEAKYKWSSEVDARFGYNFCNNVVAYALTGLRFYNKEVKISLNNENFKDKARKHRFAPVLGAGVKAKVTNNLSVGAEYRYAFERKMTDKGDVLGVLSYNAQLKQQSHAVLAKVSYHF